MQTPLPTSAIDFSRFAALRERAASADGGAALQQVADEFEALFVDLMLSAARDAGIEGGLFDSSELDTYREMLDQQIAVTMARNHDLGIARQLMREFGGTDDDAARGDGTLRFDPSRRAPDAITAPTGAPLAPDEETLGDGPAGRRAFAEALAPHASRAATTLGVAPHGVLAQAALETGWGRHVIRHPDGRSSHNYFGIKATPDWGGEVVRVPTTEYVDGRAVTVNAAFRAYPGTRAAFDDYVALLQGHGRYARVRGAEDVAGFARGLSAAGYATDPRYAEKILAVVQAGERDALWGTSAPKGE